MSSVDCVCSVRNCDVIHVTSLLCPGMANCLLQNSALQLRTDCWFYGGRSVILLEARLEVAFRCQVGPKYIYIAVLCNFLKWLEKKNHVSFLFPKEIRRIGRCIRISCLETDDDRDMKFAAINYKHRRYQWPRGLRRRSEAARLLGLWVRIPPGCMDVCLLWVLCVVR